MVMRPLSPEELLEDCDLAGEAKVLDVQADVDRDGGRDGTVARLRFTKIVKGQVNSSRKAGKNVALVSLRGSTGEAIPGTWSDPYPAGRTVFTHLVWDPEIERYTTSCWNAWTVLPRGWPRAWPKSWPSGSTAQASFLRVLWNRLKRK